MTLERFIAITKPFSFKTYKMYVRYAVILSSLVWILACIILIQIVDSEHLFLISAFQTLIWSVFFVGFMLPMLFYPIIAYNIYISNKNTIMAIHDKGTVCDETEHTKQN